MEEVGTPWGKSYRTNVPDKDIDLVPALDAREGVEAARHECGQDKRKQRHTHAHAHDAGEGSA